MKKKLLQSSAFSNLLDRCHDALKSSCDIDSCSESCFAFKMASEDGTGRFALVVVVVGYPTPSEG